MNITNLFYQSMNFASCYNPKCCCTAIAAPERTAGETEEGAARLRGVRRTGHNRRGTASRSASWYTLESYHRTAQRQHLGRLQRCMANLSSIIVSQLAVLLCYCLWEIP